MTIRFFPLSITLVILLLAFQFHQVVTIFQRSGLSMDLSCTKYRDQRLYQTVYLNMIKGGEWDIEFLGRELSGAMVLGERP